MTLYIANDSEFIDQREIQKLGGACSRYPVAYIIAKLLRTLKAERILDVTYGEGRFYKIYRPKLLLAADPNIWDWIVKPDAFIPCPVWNVGKILKKLGLESFDCIVVDPPWGERHHKRPLYNNLTSFVFPETIINHAFMIAEDLHIPYLLLHYDKIVERKGWTRVRTIEFRYVSRYLNNPGLTKTTYFILYSNEAQQE